MAKIRLFDFKKLKVFLKKLPRTLIGKDFLVFLILFLVSLVLGFFVFLRSSVLIRKESPIISDKPVQFDEEKYQEILKVWEEKERRFKETDFREHPNLFE